MVKRRPLDPLLHLFDGTADEQGRGGVQEHDVAPRARFAAEDRFRHPRVVRRIAARQLGRRRALEPERRRVDDVALDAVAGDDVGHAAAIERQLVDPVAVDHEGPLGAEAADDLGHAGRRRGVPHPEQLALRARPGW